MIHRSLLIDLCLLAACDGGDSADSPGAVTPSEAKAVQEAAEMIPPQQPAASSPASE